MTWRSRFPRAIAPLELRRRRPEAAIERFVERLGPPIAADELMLQATEALRAGMRAASAELWTVDGNRVTRAVAVPHRGEGDSFALAESERRQLARPSVHGPSWARIWTPTVATGREGRALQIATVVDRGEPLGLLVVERPAGEDFDSSEAAALADLARHLGLALGNERLRAALERSLTEVRAANEQLRASRARVVAAADAERRRIERDLHDGAQQRLIALSIAIERARKADGAEGAALLETASAMAAESIAELSDLAQGIYPQALGDSGLGAALRIAAARHPGAVRVEIAERVDRHPPAVEAAVYFAILEGLQNAAKHAPGARVTVTLDTSGDGIVFSVADDGPGFEVGEGGGQGMINIADRVGAVGGVVEWEAAAGAGTRMTGRVPLAGAGETVP